LQTFQKSEPLAFLHPLLNASIPVQASLGLRLEIIVDLLGLLAKSKVLRPTIIDTFGLEFFLNMYTSFNQDSLSKAILKLLKSLMDSSIRLNL
jgi:hypothetical protein